MRPTGYEPLSTLKPLADDLWLVDGPAIRFYGMPFSTRATLVRLASGDIWVHSPTRLTNALAGEVAALGPVRHLIAPNWIHYAHLPDWQARFPAALAWAAPGVRERAATRGMAMRFDRDLAQAAPADWADEIDQMIVEGHRLHREAVFIHRPTRSLILTDLIENFEAAKLPLWMRIGARLAGILDPDGKAPVDMRMTFRGAGRDRLRGAVRQMIDWAPERIILAHGRCYDGNCVAELERAFRWVLQAPTVRRG